MNDVGGLQQEAIEAFEAGNYAEAAARAREAVALCDNGIDRSNLLGTLGKALEAQEHIAEAAACFKEAHAALRRLRGPDAIRLRARSLQYLAGSERFAGRYAAAEKLLLRALREKLPRRDPERGNLHNDLGVVYKFWGRYDDAAAQYKRAAALPGVDRATLLHNLGGLEHSRGRYARGAAWARKGAKLREAQVGPNHPALAADLGALAALLDGQGKRDEAEQLYLRALKIFRRALGPRSYEVAVNEANLAVSLADRGLHARAEKLYRHAIDVQEEVLGKQHPDLGYALNNLASLLRDQGRLPEARAAFRRALRVFEKGLGARHPSTLAVGENLARLGRSQRAG